MTVDNLLRFSHQQLIRRKWVVRLVIELDILACLQNAVSLISLQSPPVNHRAVPVMRETGDSWTARQPVTIRARNSINHKSGSAVKLSLYLILSPPCLTQRNQQQIRRFPSVKTDQTHLQSVADNIIYFFAVENKSHPVVT